MLRIIDRGREAYAETWKFQQLLVQAAKSDAERPDCLVFVEHEPVYTLGRGKEYAAKPANGIPWAETTRGGQATYHGPGQLVAYPIFDLNKHGRDLRAFVHKLEEVVLRALRTFGIEGQRIDNGIWVDSPARKVASFGVGVDQWISFHGLAINLNTDLEAVRAINPCGIDGGLFVNLADICQASGLPVPTMDQLKEAVASAFVEVFQIRREAAGFGDAGRKLPEWMRVPAPGSSGYKLTQNTLRDLKLVTVCEEARCPNHGECWNARTATFMIMGELCTRRCGFCSVKDGTLDNLEPLSEDEPQRVAEAVRRLGLRHVVVTSVNRDDLPDMGAGHFDRTVRAIKEVRPSCQVEFLTPDMRGRRELVEMILASGQVAVFNHNFETVPHLYPTVRPGAKTERSLNVLKWAKEFQPNVRTKSGLMLGLGETRSQVYEVMDMLRGSNVDVLTLGQYLRPTEKQLPIARFVSPDEFAEYKLEGMKRGFKHVESGPLVRSSYHAAQHTDEPPVMDDMPLFEPEPLLQLGMLARR